MRRRKLILGAVLGIFIASILTWIDKSVWQFLEIQVLDGRSYLSPISHFGKVEKDIVILKFDEKTEKFLKDHDLLGDVELSNVEALSTLGQLEDSAPENRAAHDRILLLEMAKNLNSMGAATIAFAYNLDAFEQEELEIEANLEGVEADLIFANLENTNHRKQFNGGIYKVAAYEGFAYEVFKNYVNSPRKISKNKNYDKLFKNYKKQIAKIKDQSKAEKLWLNTSKIRPQEYSIARLIKGKIDPSEIKGKIAFITLGDRSYKTELRILANYLGDKWVRYTPIASIIFGLLMIGLGIFFAISNFWIRIISYLAINLFVFFKGQVLYSLFHVHIETMPLFIALMGLLILSSIVEMNLAAFSLREKLRFVAGTAKQEADAQHASGQGAFLGNSNDLIKSITYVKDQEIKDQRNKFYVELEDNYEHLALQIQEKTVSSLNGVHTKVNDLLRSEDISARDENSATVIAHELNKLMDDMDNMLFELIPFRFEDGNGVLTPIKHLLDKVMFKSRGLIRASLDAENTNIDSLKQLDYEVKVNVFRIIQGFIASILDKRTASNISLAIVQNGPFIEFIIKYNGLNLDPRKLREQEMPVQLAEIYRRIDVLNAALSFQKDESDASGLSNKILINVPVKVKA